MDYSFFSRLFRRGTEHDTAFKEALSVVQNNNKGNCWIVGGYVFRTIARQLYGSAQPAPDLDIIAENPTIPPELPRGWKARANKFGSPKLIGPGEMILDLIPLTAIHSVKQRGLRPSIRNYLSGVPLTIQAIAYDIRRRQMRGATGIRALQNRTVGINNIKELEYNAEISGHSPKDLLHNKAKPLGFRVVL